MRSSTKELKHFKKLPLQQCSSVCWCLINVIMFWAKLGGIKVPWQARRGSIIHQPGAILHHSIHPVRLPNREIMGKHLRSALSHCSAAEKQLDTQSPPSASAHLHDRGGPEAGPRASRLDRKHQSESQSNRSLDNSGSHQGLCHTL